MYAILYHLPNNVIVIKEGDVGFTPYNSNPMSAVPEIYHPGDSVLFPDNTFAIELKIVITRPENAPANESTKVKLQVFACFEKGPYCRVTNVYHDIWISCVYE